MRVPVPAGREEPLGSKMFMVGCDIRDVLLGRDGYRLYVDGGPGLAIMYWVPSGRDGDIDTTRPLLTVLARVEGPSVLVVESQISEG
ncbi:MAG: hypothetical protein B7733_23295 [Myxococcales bacterium FL481]|nr:MAG: hypothetical protein B7733_23295 [Myxococcales bacterium FL481]